MTKALRRDLDHSTVSSHLRECLAQNRRVRVDIGNRVSPFLLHHSSEIGWYVVPNNQNRAFVLHHCQVRYDKTHNPTRWLYLAAVGPILPDRAPKARKITLEPRNPAWSATDREDERAERITRASRITLARKQLLAADRVLATLAMLREAQQWLYAIALQADAARVPAAKPLHDLAARIAEQIRDLPD